MTEISTIEIPSRLRQIITTDMAWSYKVVPLTQAEDAITFVSDSNGSHIINELEILLGKDVLIQEVDTHELNELLLRNYPRNAKNNQSTGSIQVSSEDFIVKLIGEAKELRSSDIHIEPYETTARVRIRIDGKLIERYTIQKTEYPSVVNRVKIMAHLDIAEKRLPQDGRIFFNNQHVKFDIRVSVLPTLFGEKIVLRILSNDASEIHLGQLGFTEPDLTNYLEAARQPNGIILISGPTGSGKTTTLYATLKLLNKNDRNILTIEDPIEYTLKGINQVQLKEDIGMDFPRSLKTFLRQDPDIIMVGEIRDKETAQMAVRASLTGHLVLSTIHTNSAWGTVSRLIDMGIPSYLIASTLKLSVAQRLVRILCEHCKKNVPFTPNLFPKNFRPQSNLIVHFLSVGCEHCYYTGYRGRRAIYEVIPIEKDLIERIKEEDLNIEDIRKEMKIRLLSEQAFELLCQGLTSVEEVYPLLF